MLDINLLPPSQKQKRLALALVTYVTIGFVAILFVFGVFAIMLTTIKITINEKIGGYDTKITTLKRQIAQYQSLEQDVIQTNSSLRLAITTLDKQLKPATILDSIAGKVGPTNVLTSVTVGQKDLASAKANAPTTSGIPLTISGDAQERAHVIDFKRALEADDSFHDVTYTLTENAAAASSASTASAKKALFSFTITTSYLIPSPSKSTGPSEVKTDEVGP